MVDEESNVKITKHGSKRVRERLGVNKKSVARTAERALNEGLDHNDLTGVLRKYVDRVYLKEKKANNIKVYGDKLYVFKDNILITVLQLSTKLSRISAKLTKKKENAN